MVQPDALSSGNTVRMTKNSERTCLHGLAVELLHPVQPPVLHARDVPVREARLQREDVRRVLRGSRGRRRRSAGPGAGVRGGGARRVAPEELRVGRHRGGSGGGGRGRGGVAGDALAGAGGEVGVALQLYDAALELERQVAEGFRLQKCGAVMACVAHWCAATGSAVAPCMQPLGAL